MPRGRGRGRGRGAAKRKAAAADDDNEPQPKVQREDSQNTQIRKALKEAKESVDQNKTVARKLDYCFRVCHSDGVIHEDYSCMLSQTNIGQNNNKFYIIQLAKEKKKYYVFTRWGRVGEMGQHNTDTFTKVDDAVKAFEKKFKDKTKNNWANRDNFQPVPKKYTLLEVEDSDSEDDGDDDYDRVNQKDPDLDAKMPCSLDKRTQLMISLIFNEDMFVNRMIDMDLDVKKMPLGKLSKAQIAKGLEALMDIEDAIKKKKPRDNLTELSSKFFTLIPHNFGRSVPPVIDTDDFLQKKKNVMLTLSDIELAQSLQKEKDKKLTGTHPLEEKYQTLDCVLEYIDKKSSEFKLLKEYATACPETREGPILDAWRVDRQGEKDRFKTHDDIKHRKLLWHGTSVAVVAAILKAGLRIMPHSGGLVGRGIYFASEHAKSAWYVDTHHKYESEKEIGFMFLVEVALGKESSTEECKSHYTKAPKGFDSVVARGRNEPDPKKNKKVVFDGREVIVPVGKPVPQKEWANSGFDQSEYLVYKESQARIRYVLKFSFDSEAVW